jgi:SAM-dependent methyltransferase
VQFTLQTNSLLERLALWLNLGPVPLVQAFFGMAGSRVVMAGARLGVYAALAQRPSTAAELARTLGTSPTGLELLLRSLQALDLVDLRGETFSLASRARRWLDPRSDRYVGDFLSFNYAQWEWWSQLESTVQTGRGPAIHDYPPDDSRWGEYMRAMFQLARLVAPEVVPRIRLPPGARQILDLGGGHGWFSASLCRRHPGLRSTVIDLPGAARAGRQILEAVGAADAVEHVEGDARTADLGTGRDGVLVFQLIHHLTPEEDRHLLERIAAALRPGGVLAILELFRPRWRGRPDASALMGLHYFLTSSTASYEAGEVARWVQDAGFERIRITPVRRLPLQSLLVATRR